MNFKNYFSRELLKWYKLNPRDLPWKKTNDPYKIWLSEIIMQQTRVEQGMPYYEKMVQLFPTVKHLAGSREGDVMYAWQGLGYYSRARNMHAVARQIVKEQNGKFPSSHSEILKLKGVGAYTAAAIASFAFNLPHAVVDGNVFRVLSRAFGVKAAIDSTEGKKIFSQLAHELLDKKKPADYNQAIMNFGAMVCTPNNPSCSSCFFQKKCFAFTHQMVTHLPVKEKKTSVRVRWFNFLILEDGNKVIIEKRKEKDIWKSLFQFPLIETKTFTGASEIIDILSKKKILAKKDCRVAGVSTIITHKLSHQTLMSQFIRISVAHSALKMFSGWKAVGNSELKNFPFPKLISNYFEKRLH